MFLWSAMPYAYALCEKISELDFSKTTFLSFLDLQIFVPWIEPIVSLLDLEIIRYKTILLVYYDTHICETKKSFISNIMF
jgi:hypothetical protein